jgi:F-type H+-transporting ATPase subunit b
MIVLDSSIIWQIVIFLLLWFILAKVLFKPYMAVLEEREQKTAGALDESSSLEHEAELLRVRYEEGLASARTAGNAVKDKIIQEGRQKREALLNEARDEAARILEQVRLQIQSELSRERELALREADTVAQEMVSKVLGRRVG